MQTPQEVLQKWAITRTGALMTPAAVKGMVSAVLSGAPGAQIAHVLKARDPKDHANDLELETVRRSCQALLQVRCSSSVCRVADNQLARAAGSGCRGTFSAWCPCTDLQGHPAAGVLVPMLKVGSC